MKECLTIIKFKDRIFIMLRKNTKKLGVLPLYKCRCWFTQGIVTSPNICGVVCNQMVFWGGQFSTNFDLKNMISTNTKGFSWNKLSTVGNFPETKFQITRLL
jgi:hypothetical protein